MSLIVIQVTSTEVRSPRFNIAWEHDGTEEQIAEVTNNVKGAALIAIGENWEVVPNDIVFEVVRTFMG